LRVLLVDRATFPSDTVSTHVVQPWGVRRLAEWGLLDRLQETGCPPVHTFSFELGPITISGSPGTTDFPVAYAPRRIVLDRILLDAAIADGAEVRQGFTVSDYLIEDGRVVGVAGRDAEGRRVTERARVVVGADGVHSGLARAVGAEAYREKPALLCGYYAYYAGLPTNGVFETYVRPDRGFAAVETNDGLTMVVAGWPYAEFGARKADLEGSYRSTVELAPEFADRVRSAERRTRIVGSAVPNYLRVPFGPGWALVGDAGYCRDFITAQGISDAFRDAESISRALTSALGGERTYEDAMAEHTAARDAAVLPMYEMTTELATLQPPTPAEQALFAAIAEVPATQDAFVRANAGTDSPAAFFAPDNLARILRSAGS
jgi:2-polyprenyl-6-methoxyphenol hydroxylase-like FAD-dependent oxidoreductase